MRKLILIMGIVLYSDLSYGSEYNPCTLSEEKDATCFTCGETCSIRYSEVAKDNGTTEKILTVSGYGPMGNREDLYPGIVDKGQGVVTKVVVEDGITTVGYNAFYNFQNLTEVKLPSSLIALEPGAFQSCVSLTSLILPDGVDIQRASLQGSGLTSLVIPENAHFNPQDDIFDSPDYGSAPLKNIYCSSEQKDACAEIVSYRGDNVSIVPYNKEGDFYVIQDENGNNVFYNSTNDMAKGSDYSCGATTSICSTVLSEVGGANCNTIKSCRNLAEMADENVYCNSMSSCKELTDMVGSEYCDSLESCKALSDMAASGEYCSTVAECKALNDMVGGENCDSLESCKALSDMAASGEYCSTVAECKRFMDLMNSGYCEGFAACKEMFNASVINYDGKRYGSLEDLYNGNALPSITRQEQGDGSFAVYKDGVFVGYKGKRIYTVNEAENVTGRKNTLKIRYR